MLRFRDLMESALYDPEAGFYSRRVKTADFYTAPELHPAFGEILADRIASLLARCGEGPLILVEAGCGEGLLAAQVARRLKAAHPALLARTSLALVERTPADLLAAARRLEAEGVAVLACRDLSLLPPFRGVLYANELLDALPFHVLERRGEAVLELFEGGALGAPTEPEVAAAAARVELPEGARHAVGLEAARWFHAAAARLSRGFLLAADYGKRFAPEAPNPPRAFLGHRVSDDILTDPGSRDLTASVDFAEIIRAGTDAGLELDAYQSLARFLIDGGIMRHLAASEGGAARVYSDRAKLKTLLHPEGMGEAFKVLVMRRDS